MRVLTWVLMVGCLHHGQPCPDESKPVESGVYMSKSGCDAIRDSMRKNGSKAHCQESSVWEDDPVYTTPAPQDDN